RGLGAMAGIGESESRGPWGRDARAIALSAIERAIADAGLKPADIDGLMVCPSVADQITPADYHAHFGTHQPLWFSPEGGGMVWAATCAHTAAQALARGDAKYILNVFAVDWASRRASGTGTPGDWHASEPMKAHFELPYGWFPQPVYFATFARRYMHDYRLTPDQLGALPVAFRRHANSHPDAVMHSKALSLEDYLARPLLADPLRVEDCCLISDGGAAYVMTTPERARDLRQPAVIVEGVGHGRIDGVPYISQQGDITATPQTFSAPWAMAMADISPAELDVIAVYDCFSITALMQIEDMGFCAKGEGGEFIQGKRLHFDRPRSAGGIPCNTHGGLLSHAYVLGIAHVVELVKQLRGSAVNQVRDARLAAYAGFTADEASTLILRRDDA
ncbi:MAG: thiolase family protein, partial [Spongiibacteraceae bacterium]|nr:thiolase family protein [Spongiibacteraceae bacterium]